MAVPQQKFRELVFQLLYSYDMGRANEIDMIELMMAELAVTKKTVRTAQESVQAILSKQPEIDALIAKTSTSYAFERIQSVERNILRLGAFEVLFDQSVPPKVAIAEAMRLSRKFGTLESASFVNAILDSIYKATLGEPVDAEQLKESVQLLVESEIRTEEIMQTLPDDDSENQEL